MGRAFLLRVIGRLTVIGRLGSGNCWEISP